MFFTLFKLYKWYQITQRITYNHNVLKKGLFASIKGHFCLTKGHLDYPEGRLEIKSTLTGSCFCHLTLLIQILFFSKRVLFNEASDPRTLYLFKICPDVQVKLMKERSKPLKAHQISTRYIRRLLHFGFLTFSGWIEMEY